MCNCDGGGIFGKIGRVSLHFAAQLKAELQLAFAVADS
jgi:hypothetical protein